MAAYHLDRCTLSWLKSWLDVLAQRVVMSGVTATSVVREGPYGLELQSVLFYNFINDLHKGIECILCNFLASTSWEGLRLLSITLHLAYFHCVKWEKLM